LRAILASDKNLMQFNNLDQTTDADDMAKPAFYDTFGSLAVS